MWLRQLMAQRLVDRAQPYVEVPLLAAAAFGWPVTWESSRHPVQRPELAGGLPRSVLIALSAQQLHVLATAPSRFAPDRSRRIAAVVGAWDRAAVPVRVQRTTGAAPLVTLALPGRPLAQLHGLHGAGREFLDLLCEGAPALGGPAPVRGRAGHPGSG